MLNTLAGIIASSGGAAAAGTSYESISTVTVGSGGTSSITFSSIPSTYQHLQIRFMARTTRSLGFDPFLIRMNSDTTAANYASHALYGSGSSAVSNYTSGESGTFHYLVSAATSTASVFGAAVIDVLDYANTNKYKTTRSLAGYDGNGSGYICLNSGLWMNTNAITTLTIVPFVGSNFVEYSSFALYGIKG